MPGETETVADKGYGGSEVPGTWLGSLTQVLWLPWCSFIYSFVHSINELQSPHWQNGDNDSTDVTEFHGLNELLYAKVLRTEPGRF